MKYNTIKLSNSNNDNINDKIRTIKCFLLLNVSAAGIGKLRVHPVCGPIEAICQMSANS